MYYISATEIVVLCYDSSSKLIQLLISCVTWTNDLIFFFLKLEFSPLQSGNDKNRIVEKNEFWGEFLCSYSNSTT